MERGKGWGGLGCFLFVVEAWVVKGRSDAETHKLNGSERLVGGGSSIP